LDLLESEDPDKDISLYVNSPGGSVYAAASTRSSPSTPSATTS
jgi:ATP-dependent protease ClpP protease subunit